MRFIKLFLIALAVTALGPVAFVYLAPGKATRLIINADRARSDLVRKELALPDGLLYVYLEGGSGAPLMLLHGFGANKDNFTWVARHLTHRCRLIIPDHIGFGESSRPQNADYSPTAQAKRLRAFAHALGIDRLHLGGSSMGGQIAMTYAALFPGEVESLWLLDPAGVWSAPKTAFQTVYAETGRNTLMAKNVDEYAAVLKTVMLDPPFIPRPIMNVLARERISNYALEERIFQQIATDSVENRASHISIPTLIVWGENDRVLSVAAADHLHRLMPRSKRIIMRNTGHLPMMEQPKQTARDYLEFRGVQ